MKTRFKSRSEKTELMDDLECGGEVISQTLLELEVINKWLGGNAVTISGVRRLLNGVAPSQTISLVDVGCGGGDMLRLLSKWSRHQKRSLILTGIDANPNIVRYAAGNNAHIPNTRFVVQNIFSDEFKSQQFDILIGTLFFHHFTDDQLIDFFSSTIQQTRLGIVVNDIHRHWLAYYSIAFLTRVFSRSFMVRADAPLSVLRAFKKHELLYILKSAGIKKYELRWRWAFRWQLVIWRQ